MNMMNMMNNEITYTDLIDKFQRVDLIIVILALLKIQNRHGIPIEEMLDSVEQSKQEMKKYNNMKNVLNDLNDN